MVPKRLEWRLAGIDPWGREPTAWMRISRPGRTGFGYRGENKDLEESMNRKRIWMMAIALGAVALATGTTTRAQAPLPERLSGNLSDFTGVVSAAGPWEMRGHWSLHLKGKSGTADFSAYMTMELTDTGITLAGGDPTKAGNRSAHTHHIVLTDGTLSTDPADLANTSICPAFSPANTPKFVVSGLANFISGNGNDAPFEKNGTMRTTLYVCISGATNDVAGVTPEVEYSNMTMSMVGPAADKHFGSQPINGAVRFIRNGDDASDKEGR